MHIQSIFDVDRADDGVFVDNLMVCSADRLLSTRYYQFVSNEAFRDPRVITLLVSHDILNLAALLESVVCHERIYVNAEYIDRWNAHIADNTLRPFNDIIVPVAWPVDLREEAEGKLRKIGFSTDSGLSRFADLVFTSTHYRFSRHPVERRFFVPYEEGSTIWGTPFYIGMGMGFYLLSSQILGIPYKPSVLRAQMLLRRVGRSRRFGAAEIAIALLEKGRERVAREYLDRILEQNVIEVHMPCILATVLREAKSPDDVIPIVRQLRDSSEARAFRKWAEGFSQSVQNGDLADIGRFVRELEEVTESVDKFLGLTASDSLSMSLGWGPIEVGYDFSLPKILARPIHFRRHLWFLHRIYSAVAVMARLSDHIERVLIAPLPRRFQEAIRRVDWNSIQEHVDRAGQQGPAPDAAVVAEEQRSRRGVEASGEG